MSSLTSIHHESFNDYFRMIDSFFTAVRKELSPENLSGILALRDTREAKPDGSYVTQGDLRVQEILFRAARAHLASPYFVSEELKLTDAPPENRATIVVIDPIDGTENFTSGLPEWGVSISCFRNGRHAGSLIGSPEIGVWLQSGFTLVRRFQSRIRGLSSSLTKEQILAATEGYEYRILGCCVYNMIQVIRGSFQSFENPKGANSWDILGGLNLALEQGLTVTVEGKNYAGEYLPPTRKYRFKVGD